MGPEEDTEKDAIVRLMGWLEDKPEEVWIECADRCVHDDGGTWILNAIAGHPRCTKQVAASIFWWMAPYEVARRILEGGRLKPDINEFDMIVDQILRNWREGFYQAGEIRLEVPSDLYKHDILKEGSVDPLNIPADLLGNFAGREAVVDSKMPPFGNSYFWDAVASYGLDRASRPNDFGDDHSKLRQNVGHRPQRGLGLILIAFSLSLLGVLLYFRR